MGEGGERSEPGEGSCFRMKVTPHPVLMSQATFGPPSPTRGEGRKRGCSSRMKAAVLVFPGINRERDMARTLKLTSGHEPAMVWHAETELPAGTDLVVIPGFSYGDYLRCGAIAARSPIMNAVRAFAGKGGLTLGVCNGFQILCEAGLLPGVLMRNSQPRASSAATSICGSSAPIRRSRAATMPGR